MNCSRRKLTGRHSVSRTHTWNTWTMNRAYITTRRPILAGAFLLDGGRVQKRASSWSANARIAVVILGNRIGCLFRELREDSSASLVSAGGANRGNLRGLVRFFLSVYLAHAFVHRSICERAACVIASRVSPRVRMRCGLRVAKKRHGNGAWS